MDGLTDRFHNRQCGHALVGTVADVVGDGGKEGCAGGVVGEVVGRCGGKRTGLGDLAAQIVHLRGEVKARHFRIALDACVERERGRVVAFGQHDFGLGIAEKVGAIHRPVGQGVDCKCRR